MLRARTPGRPAWLSEAATLAPLLVVLVGALEYAARTGAGRGSLVQLGLAFLVSQVLPGALVWRAVRPREGWLVEDLCLGGIVGAAVAVPAQVLAAALDLAVLPWLLGWVVAAALLAVPASRRRVRDARWAPLPPWWGPVVAVSTVGTLSLTTGIFTQPLPGTARWTTQYLDLPYHQALVAELAHRFPPHTPQVASEPLDYHWFAHAWMAALGTTAGAPLDVVVLRFVPVLMTVVVLVAVACVTMRVAERVVAGPTAALVTTAGGTLALGPGWLVGGPVVSRSPTTGMAAMVGLALVALLALRWRGRVPAGTWPVVLLLALVAGGSKGSWLPVCCVGAVLAGLVAVVARHRHRGRVLLDTALLVLSLVFLLGVLFRGNVGGTQVVPADGLVQVFGDLQLGLTDPTPVEKVLGTCVLLLCIALPRAAAFVMFGDRATRWDPVLWLLLGTGCAGAGALVVLRHPGAGQVYFWTVAGPAVAVVTAWGLVALARSSRLAALLVVLAAVLGWALLGPLHPLLPGYEEDGVGPAFLQLGVVVAVLAGFAVLLRAVPAVRARAGPSRLLALVLVGGLLGAGSPERLARITSTPFEDAVLAAGPARGGSVTSGQVEAMRWIADHTDPDDVVMTNRHCTNLGTRCANRRFWLAAYGERRVLVEGWGYTRRSNEAGEGDPDHVAVLADFWDPGLLSLNDGFYTSPTLRAARCLYDLGVRWVYAERSSGYSDDLARVAERVFANRDAAVYRLTDPGGTS